MRTDLTRRDFLRVTGVGLATLSAADLLAACVGQSSSSTSTVTLNFWHGYSDLETKAFNSQVIPAFESANPGIKINAQAVPYDAFHRKLVTAIAGGEAPDAIRSDIIWVPEFADMGALAPLDQVMPDFADFQSKVFPGPLASNYYKGHYYGLPLDTNTRVLIWDPNLYQAAGLSGPPKTIDDFSTMVAKLSGSGKFGYAEGGTGAWNVLPWIWSFGGAITDDQVTKSTGYLDGAGSVAALTWFVGLYSSHQQGPSVLGGDPHTDVGFGKGTYANILDGPWMQPILSSTYPSLKYNFSPVPAGKGGSISVVGGEDIVMFKESKHQKETLQFIRFMLSENTQLTMGKIGQMPVLSSLAGNSQLPDYYTTFQEQLKTAKVRTPHPAWPQMDDLIGTAVANALKGSMSPQQALSAAASKIDALIGAK
jgi:ABC-type glycerol-3-phosphate transport system substrate-binding protein